MLVSLNKRAKPAFTQEGLDPENTSYIASGIQQPYKVGIEAKAGIRSLKISHSSSVLFNNNMPYSFDLLTLDQSVAQAMNSIGFTWNGVVAGTTELMELDFSDMFISLPLGEYEFTIAALDKQNQEVVCTYRFTVIPDCETTTIGSEAWGKHAFVYGKYNTIEQPDGITFEYKKVVEPTWRRFDGEITVDGTNYSARLVNLEAGTVYMFRSVSANDISNELEFTTLGADQIPNMSFDNRTQNGTKHWYPNASLDAADYWWDSGNEGANTIGTNNPTRPEESVVAVSGSGKKSAKLQTMKVAGQLAAGSMFLGDFGKASLSPLGAKLSFGRPYTCKPLALRGYFHYAPASVKTHSSLPSGANIKNGDPDRCQIYVLLADWNAPFDVSTGDGIFVNVNGSDIIAYGNMECNENTGGWREFEIELEYRDNRLPKYCLIVCSSSMYGDFFTGGEGSVLYIDEFEFVF